MKIENTLTRKKEEFSPIKKGEVGIYQCGPTLYWTQHIGNLRASLVGDIIHRTFLYNNYKVNFVRNYTDVGHLTGDNEGDADSGQDRMEKAAQREHKTPEEIANFYQAQFEKDIKLLNILPVSHSPKATDHIVEMQKMISSLLEKGFAYETDLAVYFDITKKDDYTKLSNQNIENNKSGHGHGDVLDKDKKNPEDFALWFFKSGTHSNALQTWQSPFHSNLVDHGEGFPGWHIECSAMSKKYLGNHFDLHLGGVEHIPVHHTNEIAQSESANDSDFVNYWIHYEHLLFNNGKLSKSAGTSISLEDVINKSFSPTTLRLFFLQAHYRSKQNFTWESLEASKQALQKIYNEYESVRDEDEGEINKDFKDKFLSALNDDFNTPKALAIFFDLLKSNISPEDKKATILDFDKVLGLGLESYQESEFLDINTLPEDIVELISQREKARKESDWNKSDELRDLLKEKGYIVKDTAEGPKISK